MLCCISCCFCFFFFKQKTAYEMRISDWSSDVCSSDLAIGQLDPRRTLVIIASKSFTTTEPLANAEVAMNWLRDAGVADPVKHVEIGRASCRERVCQYV